MMYAIRRTLGRFAYRFQVYASAYEQELARTQIGRIAVVDATVTIGRQARFSNAIGRREDIRIGKNSSIQGEIVTFPQGGSIAIGQCSFVGPGTIIWSAASIRLGQYVLVSHNVSIIDNISHSIDWRERRKEIDVILPSLRLYNHEFDLKAEPIEIEDDVWIGFGSSILRGVHIGRGAIVGAGTMVTRDVPAFTTVVGNPMRIIHGPGAVDGSELITR